MDPALPIDRPSAARAWVAGLRRLRSGLYRLASPVEAIGRRLRGVEPLPPLWLRRHAGDPRRFRDAARDTAQWLERLDLIQADSRVLDVGCGCGAMVPELDRRLGPEGTYLGFDVHAPSVAWCREAYGDGSRVRFELAEVASPYATRRAGTAIDSYRFPAADASIDLVLAKSVFTHLLDRDARHYLREIRRVLAPTGRAMVTFFLFDGTAYPEPPAFPYPPGPAPVRWRVRHHPPAAVAFDRSLVEATVLDSGLRLDALIEGYWPGGSSVPAGQDQLVLRRDDAPTG